MENRNPVEAFWEAVIRQDYETVRKAIADGFDVNARLPGKAAPITFAQPAEDMPMLKLLWEAGAEPATPWLEAVFADFARGGDGSAFRSGKPKAVGKLTLQRYNGDEIFEIETAVMRIEGRGGRTRLSLEIATHGRVEKSLPDTAGLLSQPGAQIAVPLEGLTVAGLVGKRFSLPQPYDEVTGDYLATFYYVEHEPLEANEVEIVSRKKDRFLVRWQGTAGDVNDYDGSKPDARISIEAWFSLKGS